MRKRSPYDDDAETFRKLRYFFLIGLFLFLTSCDLFTQPGERVVMEIGERHITENDLKKDMRRFTLEMGFKEQKTAKIQDILIDRIVDHYLILEYGREEGIVLTDEEFETALKEIRQDYPDKDFRETLLQQYIDYEEWKVELREQLLIKKILKRVSEGIPPVSFQEIKSYFEAHGNEFRQPQMVRFRQIVTQTLEEAKKVEKALSEGRDFGDLAREFSITPEAEKGGEVGWIAKGELDEEMEKAIFSLPVGKPSPISKTPYGYHIYEVLSKQPEGVKSFPEAMAGIESKLFDERQNAYYSKWLRELRAMFPVKVNRELLENLEWG